MNLKKIENICILAPQVPFIRGGAEILVDALKDRADNLVKRVDIIKIPYNYSNHENIIRSCFEWRLLDLETLGEFKIDLVIATKFPSYFINFNRKITWLVHQFRQIYELFGSEYGWERNKLSTGFRKKVMDWDKRFLMESERVFSISKNVANKLKKYNNIDSEVLYPPPIYDGEYCMGKYGDYILSVGRINKWKRLDILINAFKYTKTKVKCYIAGEGEDLDLLKEKVHKENLEDRIVFLGFVNKKKLLDIYANCLAVYFAPMDEDYGYITVEAFKSAKPVITLSDSGGVLEFVKHNLNGIIIKDDGGLKSGREEFIYKEIAKNIDSLFNSKDYSKRLGEVGFKTVKNINWDYTLKKLLNL